MTIELVLFFLRIVSAIALIAILGVLMRVIWYEYRKITEVTTLQRRSFGHLEKLILVDDKYTETGEKYTLSHINTMGRAPTNTIVIKDSFASSEHALVVVRNGHWWVEDRKSRNGTLLNEEPVTMPVIITENDIIRIGNVGFRVRLMN